MGRFGGLGLLLASSVIACAPSATKPPSARAIAPHAPSTAGTAAASDVFAFSEATSSPRTLAEIPAELVPFLQQCARGDAALARVAERIALGKSQGKALPDVSEVSFALRAYGSPYVWPRAWALQGGELLVPTATLRLQDWLRSLGDGGERRCGLALVARGEQSVLSAVAANVLADLQPIAVRQRAGSWIDVDARLLVEASDVKVIVLGPSGAPHAVPTSFDGERARARFRADRAGAFLIQLLASVAGGPRPVLEAVVYADMDPPSTFVGVPAPGEPSPEGDPAAALLQMLNLARESEQRAPLARDAELDALASDHAQAMRRLGHIAHDSGDGDPRSRVEAARLNVLSTGENVAHAFDVTRAHRLLWGSPSHRENLLEARFDRVGIGTAADEDGSIWVCELFADFAD